MTSNDTWWDSWSLIDFEGCSVRAGTQLSRTDGIPSTLCLCLPSNASRETEEMECVPISCHKVTLTPDGHKCAINRHSHPHLLQNRILNFRRLDFETLVECVWWTTWKEGEDSRGPEFSQECNDAFSCDQNTARTHHSCQWMWSQPFGNDMQLLKQHNRVF